MTSSNNRASKKTASTKSSETAAERKTRLASERREKLAAQMPKFSLAGFKSEAASPETAVVEPSEAGKKDTAPQVTEPAESPADIFAGFTADDEDASSAEDVTTEPVVPAQQDIHSAPHTQPVGAATTSVPSAGPAPQEATGLTEASPSSRSPRTEVSAEAAPAAPEQQSNRITQGQEVNSATVHSAVPGSPREEQQPFASPLRQSATSSPAPAQSTEVAHRSDGREGGYSISVSQQGGPMSRRQRRPRVERFDPSQRQTSREEALRELQASAPRYSALLVAYRVGQLSTVPHENRNVHLYGAAFEQLANQGTSDKALFMQLTGQRHKLTPAHYVDAVLETALRPLDPMCVDEELIEDEKDHVEKLADMAFAYRSYILNNEYLAGMQKQRFTCTLRRDVNTKVSRMMDLLSSMPTIKIQPFEIISAVVADYLNGLPDERSHVESFFAKSTVTTYQ
ncbi:atrophin-1 family protein [Streptomyces tauricus]|uniref:hypothetical protein n=1 Tax=Streptomyces tauricus TaxID=68274 RepID=UPI0022439CA2|nr:hypothetical protein [Streptomyces tauricus]MCW8101701.1 hypothetical protein [Streptomyces tauricus]